METYLAYFDLLGFKDFINNTSEENVNIKFGYLLRDSQRSQTGDSWITEPNGGQVPDLTQSKVNCLHISDSIIFWTNDVNEDQFIKMIDVCNDFFQCCCVYRTFPVRGCLVKGNISFDPFTINPQKGFRFINSSLYGKALIEAYLKAEMQDWAGCYVDKSAYEDISEVVINELVTLGKLLKYPVPLKDQANSEEYTIKMIGPKRNSIKEVDVENLFTQLVNNKPITDKIQKKIDNTLKYFRHIQQS